MPAGDGTGPAGMGPMTGRAAGFCAGYAMPGYINPGIGRRGAYRGAVYGYLSVGYFQPWRYYRFAPAMRFGWGMGRGRGFGRGRGRGWY